MIALDPGYCEVMAWAVTLLTGFVALALCHAARPRP
jgi:hypothetical protein